MAVFPPSVYIAATNRGNLMVYLVVVYVCGRLGAGVRTVVDGRHKASDGGRDAAASLGCCKSRTQLHNSFVILVCI